MKILSTLLLFAAFTVLTTLVDATETPLSDSDTVLIKLDDKLNDHWVVETKVAPKYPRAAIRRKQQGCATVGYFVDADGSTSGHWVIASYPEKIFDRSAIKANKKFSYVPGPLNPTRQPVMTINTFTYKLAFGGVAPSDEVSEAIAKTCKDAAVKAIETQYGPIT